MYRGSGQDGGRVRRGDHLPSHRYIRNTSTRGTAATEHPLTAGRKRQTSQKARNSPRTWVGKKKKTETKEQGQDQHQWEGAVEERFPHTRKPLRGQRWWVVEGEASEPQRRAQPQGCGGQSRETPTQRLSAEQHSPAREACLLTRRGGRGLGAEARASVGSQGEDWGWRHEHSLKGASAPQLAGRESGKKSGAAEEARDFFLPLCFLVREERGFRAPPKRAPETGASRSYQRGPQRQA